MLKRCVFKSLLNADKLGAERIDIGKLFHSVGACLERGSECFRVFCIESFNLAIPSSIIEPSGGSWASFIHINILLFLMINMVYPEGYFITIPRCGPEFVALK